MSLLNEFSSKDVAIWSAFAFLTICIVGRKRLFTLTAIGIFFLTHVALLLVGLLAMPWLLDEYLPFSFPYLHIEYFRDQDLSKAIILVGGGVLIALGGYFLTERISVQANRPKKNCSLLDFAGPLMRIGTPFQALLALYLLAVAFVMANLAQEFSSIAQAVISGFEGETYYQARLAVESHGRWFAYVALNIIPYLCACIAGSYWLTGNRRGLTFGCIFIAFAIAILTFKKTVVFYQIMTLLGTWYVVDVNRRRWLLDTRRSYWRLLQKPFQLRALPAALVIILAFIFIAGSYYLVAGGGLSPLFAVGFAFERVFSRLTVMALIYAHYFPDIGGHYGLSNVGLISEALGNTTYDDTIITLQYFEVVRNIDGSGACGAIIDFYAAFGWSGWAVLCFILGCVLYMIDAFFAQRPGHITEKVFHIFVLASLTYIAQASIFRTLSTYGGLVVLGLWYLLRQLMPRAEPHAGAGRTVSVAGP